MVLLDTWERKNCAASIVETKLSAFSTIGKQSFCFQQTRAITTLPGLSTFILVCFFPPLVTFSLYGRVRGLFQLSILQPLSTGLIILIIAPFLSNSFSCLCDYRHSYLYNSSETILPLYFLSPLWLRALARVTDCKSQASTSSLWFPNFSRLVDFQPIFNFQTYLKNNCPLVKLAIGVRASILSQHPTEPAAPFNKFHFFYRCRIVSGGLVPIPMNVIADEWLTVRLMPHWVDQLERKDPKWHSRGAKVSSQLEKLPLCFFLLPLNNTT